jgi:uncharacterized protein (DUF1697 family)
MVGREGLTSDVLVRIFATSGATDPVSHLATGNVTFRHVGNPTDLLERIEHALAQVIGRNEPVFIRSVDHLHELVASEPFLNPPFQDVHERCVSFTAEPVVGLHLPLATRRGDAVAFDSRAADIFSVTRLVGGRPGTMGGMLERALAQPVTTRNWNTIERLVRYADRRS